MKIIDLLNKIASGEKAPQKIKYLDSVYELDERGCYSDDGDLFVAHIYIDLSNLNSEVELIEDEIDIQDIEIIKEYRTSDNDLYNDNFEDFRGTINDLVQAVKQLDKRTRKEKE